MSVKRMEKNIYLRSLNKTKQKPVFFFLYILYFINKRHLHVEVQACSLNWTRTASDTKLYLFRKSSRLVCCKLMIVDTDLAQGLFPQT